MFILCLSNVLLDVVEYSSCPSLHVEIHTTAVVRSSVVKKYGIDAVLTPAVKDLKMLRTTVSVLITFAYLCKYGENTTNVFSSL